MTRDEDGQQKVVAEIFGDDHDMIRIFGPKFVEALNQLMDC